MSVRSRPADRRCSLGPRWLVRRTSLARAILRVGEFNIAYIRGLARALPARGETTCMVYRANRAYVPRGECSTWEGQTFALTDVIAGHRARYHPPPGDRRAWSIPSGPNCHHSIRAATPQTG